MKIIAFYLPQFHLIPENEKWWGSDFTEWTNMKNAKPLFNNHYQPRIPLNNNYYNLLSDEVKLWQVKIAKEYGIYGFCYYHYWFNGKLLLEKPLEQVLNNKEIDLPFCMCWANEPWTKAWVGKEKSILIPQKYGDKKEWKSHFDYLLPFLRDSRYIKSENKPLFVIYRPEVINCLNEMLNYWIFLAQENGFDGIEFAYQNIGFELLNNKDDNIFTYNIEFQPNYAKHKISNNNLFLRSIKKSLSIFLEKRFGFNINNLRPTKKIKILSYEDVWDKVLERKPISSKCIPGAFVDWDNTPRHKENGFIIYGATPEIFRKYLTIQIKRAKEIYNKDMIFIFAWNEWAEGGYLEPDSKYGFGYLEAIRKSLHDNNEVPDGYCLK